MADRNLNWMMLQRCEDRCAELEAAMEDARRELSTCDDVRLDRTLAEGIADLQRHRAALEARVAELDHECQLSMETIAYERARVEKLVALSKRLSDALLSARPLGGSEMFIRVGEQYFADPDYCKSLIEKLRADLHEARCRAALNQGKEHG